MRSMHSMSSDTCPSRRSLTVVTAAIPTSLTAPANADQPEPRWSEAQPHWVVADESCPGADRGDAALGVEGLAQVVVVGSLTEAVDRARRERRNEQPRHAKRVQ